MALFFKNCNRTCIVKRTFVRFTIDFSLFPLYTKTITLLTPIFFMLLEMRYLYDVHLHL